MKPKSHEGLAKHERVQEMLNGPDYETQYGTHVGLDAAERLWIDTPHEEIGKPKGDRNRGLGRIEQIDPFFDYVD